MRKAHNRLDIDVSYIASEYKNGRTAQAIATELGVSKKSVLTRLKEVNVQRRQQPTHPNVNAENLTNYYVIQKLSSRKVAEILGCSNNLVIKRLEQFEIPIRQRVGDPAFSEEERKTKWGRPREEHNLWKGGVTGINEALRGATEDWRKTELRNGNFTCFISGIRKGDMHVHHITPFHELRDKTFVDRITRTKKSRYCAERLSNYTRLKKDTLSNRNYTSSFIRYTDSKRTKPIYTNSSPVIYSVNSPKRQRYEHGSKRN